MTPRRRFAPRDKTGSLIRDIRSPFLSLSGCVFLFSRIRCRSFRVQPRFLFIFILHAVFPRPTAFSFYILLHAVLPCPTAFLYPPTYRPFATGCVPSLIIYILHTVGRVPCIYPPMPLLVLFPAREKYAFVPVSRPSSPSPVPVSRPDSRHRPG